MPSRKTQKLVHLNGSVLSFELRERIGDLYSGTMTGTLRKKTEPAICVEGIGIFLCECGHARLQLGERSIPIDPGCALLLTSVHRVSALQCEADFVARVQAFPNTYFDSQDRRVPLDVHALMEIFVDPMVRLAETDLELAQGILELVGRVKGSVMGEAYRKLFLQYQIFSLMEIFLASYTRNKVATDPSLRHGYSGMAGRFLTLVVQHYREHRFVGYYAEHLDVSSKYLSSVVLKKTGVEAARWIARFVVVEARFLLHQSDLTIGEIAAELNFVDISTFGKYFRRHVGMSPKEYRRHAKFMQ